MWKSECLDYVDLASILPRAVNGEYFAKRSERCKILCNLMDQLLENLEDHGCPKVQDLAETDEEMCICSSYPFRHKTTLYCAERKIVW